MNYSKEEVKFIFDNATETLGIALAHIGKGLEHEDWTEPGEENDSLSFYQSTESNLRLDDSDEYIEVTLTQVADELSALVSFTFYPKEYGLGLEEVGDSGYAFFAASTTATRKLTSEEMNVDNPLVRGTINQLVHTVYETLRNNEALTKFRILDSDEETHRALEVSVSEEMELKLAELGWNFS